MVFFFFFSLFIFIYLFIHFLTVVVEGERACFNVGPTINAYQCTMPVDQHILHVNINILTNDSHFESKS